MKQKTRVLAGTWILSTLIITVYVVAQISLGYFLGFDKEMVIVTTSLFTMVLIIEMCKILTEINKQERDA